ncbi:MAG: membrane protein insertase YidC [Elusimicrobia bacterium]|nr:membrane protein insertase YidC [Elusimicrobiota bacterium]
MPSAPGNPIRPSGLVPGTGTLGSSGTPAGTRSSAEGAAGTSDKKPIVVHSDGSRYQFRPEGASLTGFSFKGPLGPVELVPHPLPGFFSTWPELSFESKVQGKKISFFASHPSGIRIKKDFSLSPELLLHQIQLQLENPTSSPLPVPSWSMKLGPGLGTVAAEQKENPSLWQCVMLPAPKGSKSPSLRKLSEADTAEPWTWAGLDNRYFLAALLAPPEIFSNVRSQKEKLSSYTAPSLEFIGTSGLLQPKEKRVISMSFYLGPKDYHQLTLLGQGLEKSVDFGMFGSLGKGSLWILHVFHRWTGNYGAAIILLTFLVQILISPLTYKSIKASTALKKLQPQIQAIQKKFKDDPKRMNLEMMQLYKTGGANPLGGCLPLLLQMPIFFALFKTLRNSWELHGASFIFWVKDLSAPDPYYVLPILMGGIMFFQQKQNPTSTDPAQANVMMWMPVLFTFMFLNFPSGLVLYWLTSSSLSFFQQIFIQRKLV